MKRPVFVICNWVDTRWQQYSTHLHTNNTQNNTINLGRVWAVPHLCELCPGICLTTEEKARKNLSQGSRRVQRVAEDGNEHTSVIKIHYQVSDYQLLKKYFALLSQLQNYTENNYIHSIRNIIFFLSASKPTVCLYSQPRSGLQPPLSRFLDHTQRQSVGLLRTSGQFVAETST